MTINKVLLSAGASAALMAAMAASSAAQVTAAPAAPEPPPAASCQQLSNLGLQSAVITRAEARPAGQFSVPSEGALFPQPPLSLPAFCRVAATLRPSADSDIKMEVWLPAHWNGKFMVVGNGAWSGAISYSAMAEPLARGYAVASTDTGHEGLRGLFAINHPEKLVDFAWRAVHETVLKGKAITAAYYGQGPRLSYWDGCSSGGKQGLKEIQTFPEDFDGVIVGAPANNWVRLQVQSLMANKANLPANGPPVLGPTQFAILHQAVLDQCDALDGVKDGQIADPRACGFKASSIICKPGQPGSACLTADQAAAADKIYAPVRDPKTKALIYPGMPPGSELSWAPVVMQPWTTGSDTFAIVHNDPNWDFRTLDPTQDVALADHANLGIDATSPDLAAFKARGGKIIQYHGWSDGFIPTENSINYYESVAGRQGGLDGTQTFYRLFLVPGMGHCVGAYSVDWISALEGWVEGRMAPDIVQGARLPESANPFLPPPPPTPGTGLGVRPICAYPAVAEPRARGSSSDWVCRTAPRGARSEDRA